jgi:hypothetical protein
MKEKLNSFHFILHPFAFILSMYPAGALRSEREVA